MSLELVVFAIASGLAIVSALAMVVVKTPVRSVISLVLTFFALAVLSILLAAPFIAALATIMFVWAWNQYLWPLLVTTDADHGTAVMELKELIPGSFGIPDWNVAMAGNEDDGCLGVAGSQFGLQFQPVQSWQPDIKNQAGRAVRRTGFEELTGLCY